MLNSISSGDEIFMSLLLSLSTIVILVLSVYRRRESLNLVRQEATSYTSD